MSVWTEQRVQYRSGGASHLTLTHICTEKHVIWANSKNLIGTLRIAPVVILNGFPYGDLLFGPHTETGPHDVTV